MINKFVIGNWKMHGNMQTITQLTKQIANGVNNSAPCNCVLLPPFIFIPEVQKLIEDLPIILGAQNLYPEDNGAFTGEISGTMLKDFGCKYVLIGHSERRHILKESNNFIARKFHYAKNLQLIPILCVGETLEEREKGLTLEVISNQLQIIADNHQDSIKINSYIFDNCIIAYEPVWAIGTGKTATSEQAAEVHLFIREFIDNHSTPIIYGGSVNAHNAEELFSKDNINGGLIGGASLDYTKFLQIYTIAQTRV